MCERERERKRERERSREAETERDIERIFWFLPGLIKFSYQYTPDLDEKPERVCEREREKKRQRRR